MGLRAQCQRPLPGGFLGWRKFGSTPLRAASPAPCRRSTGISCCLLPAFHLMGRGMRLQCPRAAFPLHSHSNLSFPQPQSPPPQLRETSALLPEDEGEEAVQKHPATGPWDRADAGSPKWYPPQTSQQCSTEQTASLPHGAEPGHLCPCSSNARSPSLSYFIFSSILRTQLCR